jgi:hypothetical protein
MTTTVGPPLERATRGRANDLRFAKLAQATDSNAEINRSFLGFSQTATNALKLNPERLRKCFCCARCGEINLREHSAGWDNKSEELCPRCADGPGPSFEDLYPPLFVPGIRKPNKNEIAELSLSRGIPIPGLHRAIAGDFLWARNDARDESLYLVTDSARVNISQRRLDNQLIPSIGKKAKTFPGSWASWPIGCMEAASYSLVAITEGGPDFLSLFAVKPSGVAPIMMTGASVSIPGEALEILREKRVRVFAHSDDAGSRASERWMDQLDDVGCDVDRFTFYGLSDHVSDLNDAIRKGLRLNFFENFKERK